MHVGIFGTGLTDSSERFLKKIFDENNITSSKIGTKSKNKKTDCVFVLGGDKGVRNYFHRTFDSSLPVLGINESESDGFLSQVDLKQLSSLIPRIKKMDFETEQVPRLGVKIDGKDFPHFFVRVGNGTESFTAKDFIEYWIKRITN